MGQTSILVAFASNAFSTSSFTAVDKSRITWPEQIRCTAALSMGLMLGPCILDKCNPYAASALATKAFMCANIIPSMPSAVSGHCSIHRRSHACLTRFGADRTRYDCTAECSVKDKALGRAARKMFMMILGCDHSAIFRVVSWR